MPYHAVAVCDDNMHAHVSMLAQRMFAGSNGRMYRFLLKGHEDLRQDERVMQLFGLVNALLSNDPETSKRDLLIKYVLCCIKQIGVVCFEY